MHVRGGERPCLVLPSVGLFHNARVLCVYRACKGEGRGWEQEGGRSDSQHVVRNNLVLSFQVWDCSTTLDCYAWGAEVEGGSKEAHVQLRACEPLVYMDPQDLPPHTFSTQPIPQFHPPPRLHKLISLACQRSHFHNSPPVHNLITLPPPFSQLPPHNTLPLPCHTCLPATTL